MKKLEYELMFWSEQSHWWYRALRTWLRGALRRHLLPGSWVLDAGCGTGANLAMLQKMGYRVCGVDPASWAAQFASRRPTCRGVLARGSVTQLPFGNCTFDAVVSADVLYLLEERDEKRALVEMRRVLKPGGMVFINLPAYEWLRGEHDQAISTQRRYTAAMLRKKLVAAGFDPVRIEYRCMLFLPLVMALRLLRRAKARADEARSDLAIPLGPLNYVFAFIAHLEELVGRAMRRPFGSSVAAVARRK